MSGLAFLLRAAAEANDFSADTHRTILDTLSQSAPETLPLKLRFAAASYMQRAVLYLAFHNDLKTPSPFRKDDFMVDEAALPEEMGALLTLSKSLQYSDAVYHWFADRLGGFTDGLEAAPIFGPAGPWTDLSETRKLELLGQFIGRAVAAHSPCPDLSRIKTAAAPEQYKGQQAWASQEVRYDENENSHSAVTVSFSRELLDAPTCIPAIRLAFHESIHISMQALALGYMDGRIGPDHPLHEDAKLQLASMTFDAPLPVIDSYYSDHTEEKLAYHCQHEFERVMRSGSPPLPSLPLRSAEAGLAVESMEHDSLRKVHVRLVEPV